MTGLGRGDANASRLGRACSRSRSSRPAAPSGRACSCATSGRSLSASGLLSFSGRAIGRRPCSSGSSTPSRSSNGSGSRSRIEGLRSLRSERRTLEEQLKRAEAAVAKVEGECPPELLADEDRIAEELRPCRSSRATAARGRHHTREPRFRARRARRANRAAQRRRRSVRHDGGPLRQAGNAQPRCLPQGGLGGDLRVDRRGRASEIVRGSRHPWACRPARSGAAPTGKPWIPWARPTREVPLCVAQRDGR